MTTNNAIKNYIGLTEGTFKQRFSQHKATFKHRKYTNSTELSKYIWKLRDNNQDFNIKWTIISRARPYSNISKRCDLCLTEKLMIITANPSRILNKRSELISKCRHENKFYLRNNWLKNNTLLVFFFFLSHLISWNAKGIPRLKTGLGSNFIFFVGSHKCAYPTDIGLSSDRVNLPLYPSVYPNFPAPFRNHILSPRFAIMCAR